MGKCLRKYCICLPKSNTNEIKVFNILLLGLSDSGKTEIGHKFAGDIRKDFAITNGVRKFTKSNRFVLWNMTEIGGSSDMQRIWHYYFVKTMGVIFTIDLSNLTNLPNAFKKLEETVHNQYIRGKPILIFLTKCDLVLETTINITEIEEFYNLEILANRYQSPMLLEEFSLKDDSGFVRGIEWLDYIITLNWKLLKNRIKFDSETVEKNESAQIKESATQRPHSAPSLRHKKLRVVRPRFVHTSNKIYLHQNGTISITEPEDNESKPVENPETEDNESKPVENPENKINGISKDNETIATIEKLNDAIISKDVFGHKVEHKILRKNKVADISSYKIDLIQNHIVEINNQA